MEICGEHDYEIVHDGPCPACELQEKLEEEEEKSAKLEEEMEAFKDELNNTITIKIGEMTLLEFIDHQFIQRDQYFQNLKSRVEVLESKLIKLQTPAKIDDLPPISIDDLKK